MRRAALASLIFASATGCSAPPAAPAVACLCGPTGLDLQIDFDTADESCPVDDVSVLAAFPGATAVSSIRCRDPAPTSQGPRLILSWPEGVRAGESGTVQVWMTGDDGALAVGRADVVSAPDACTVVAVHASCSTGHAYEDGGPFSPDSGPPMAAR